MKIQESVFEISAVRPAQWPEDGLPEFAFIGRSNVGKSSLLNRLLNRKALARVSAHPGKTQQINFYRINQRFRFADLPGYGYATVSKEMRKNFLKMMETYLTRREPLVRVFHLVDVRHPPTTDDLYWHQQLISWGLQVTVVATKSDKLSKSRVMQAAKQIRLELHTPFTLVPVSAEKNTGMEVLWDTIEADCGSLESVNRAATTPEEGQASAGVGDEHADDNEDSTNDL